MVICFIRQASMIIIIVLLTRNANLVFCLMKTILDILHLPVKSLYL